MLQIMAGAKPFPEPMLTCYRLEILIEILTFSFKKMCFKMFSAKWRPFCSGGDEWKASVDLCDSFSIFPQGCFNSSPPGQNGCYFADYIFKCIFVNEKFGILIWISLKFVPKGAVDNESALVQLMAWHQAGNKPLPEPMLTQFTDA